jgi:hypothetical protein
MELQLEQEMRKNYVRMLQPEFYEQSMQSAAEVGGIIARNIGESVKESAQEYGQYMKETPLKESIPTTMSELGKGLIAGVGGIVGDTEQLIYGINEILKTPEGKSKLDALIKGLEKPTKAKTSGDVEQMLEGTTGETPEGAGFPKGVGLVAAPIGTVAKAAKQTAKAVKSLKKAK